MALRQALKDWVDHYDKGDGFTGADNARERRIVELARNRGSNPDCMLYRGTGVEDGFAHSALSGNPSELLHSKRLVSSWTKDVEVARSFMRDAVDSNFSAVLLAVHSSRLDVLVDITQFPDIDIESEILALAGSLTLTADDILEAWEYDPEREECILIHRAGDSSPSPC